MKLHTASLIGSVLLLLLACAGTDQGDQSGGAGNGMAAPHAATAAATPATASAAPPAASKGGGVYNGRFAADPLLTPQQVALIPPAELEFARNEVFARYGRAFQREDLQRHFKATSWYQERADYSDSVLTQNDQANVALIKSFEGDSGKARVLAKGAYRTDYDGMELVFVDASTVEVADGTEDMYNWTRESRRWVALGDWIVTWEGGTASWNPTDPGVRSAQLWKLDHSEGLIEEVWPLSPQQG